MAALVVRITAIHQTLFRVGTFGSVLGGCVGLADSIEYTRTSKQYDKMHLLQYGIMTIGGGMILGFTAGYCSPIILPMVIYDSVEKS